MRILKHPASWLSALRARTLPLEEARALTTRLLKANSADDGVIRRACEAIATASRQLFVRAYWPAASEPGGGSNRSAALFHARLKEVQREVLERLARHAAAHPECVPHVEHSTMHPHVEC